MISNISNNITGKVGKTLLSTLTALLFSLTATAQEVTLKSKIVGTDNQPIEGAIVTIKGGASVVTDKEGNFDAMSKDADGVVVIKAPGFYDKELPVRYFVNKAAQGDYQLVLIPKSEPLYNGYVTTPLEAYQTADKKLVTSAGLEQKDFSDKLSVGAAIGNNVAGLQVIEKSGMPGEGTLMSLRGIHSAAGENNPLIVINGVPYLFNQDVSSIIEGYSRDMLAGYANKDIRSITVLKGSEAAQWGSLGSNGVVMIETQQANSDNLNTRITFSGQYGINTAKKNIPMLDANQYKSYMKDLGMTLYPNMSSLTTDYPFLQNGSNYTGSYLFSGNNNWMNEIQRTGFVTDNQLRVEGGDEIAKYNISFGYTKNNGTLDKTSSDRYHTLISADVLVSRKIDIFANVSLSYITSDLQNMGTNSSLNPMTSAMWNSPLVSAYQKTTAGLDLPEYARYNEFNISSIPTYPYNNVSNPLALINTVNGNDKIYDANASLGMNFRWNDYLTLTGLVNLYYNYTEENMFVPGATDHAIIPMYYGNGENFVSSGVLRQLTNNYSVSADYKRTFNKVHDLNVKLSARWITHKLQSDYAYGYNTGNDYFTTLDKTQDGRYAGGFKTKWNYMGYGLHGNYTWNNILRANAGFNLDAASASGKDRARFAFLPSAGVQFMVANTGWLPENISRLNISVEGSYTGNSRFNVINTNLALEKTRQLDFGVDLSLFKNRLNIGANYYISKSYDLVVYSGASKVFGSAFAYDNVGDINNNGVEMSIRVNPYHTKDVDIYLGATMAHNRSTLNSLGGLEKNIIKFEDFNGDDAQVVMQVGNNPYEFYGYQTRGVYATEAQAAKDNLKNSAGYSYRAGDMMFVDQNNDGIIDDKDKVAIGNAAPTVFGAINLGARYKQFDLDFNFGYSVGNDAYNYTRRQVESMNQFYNQSSSVLNRWQVEGQVTNIPRAAYGDPAGNNAFSDRWIEDASYLKLRSVRLTYNFNKLFNFINSGKIWFAAENLFCISKYLGGDPEFSYGYSEVMRGFDYSKMSLPRTFKIGFDLNF